MMSYRLAKMQRRMRAHWVSLVANVGRTVGILLLAAGMPAAAFADDDLPGRVGRVADVAGHLYLSPQDRAAEWAEIGRNYSVTSGDNLWVSADGRAEVDYGGGQFRLTGDTTLHVSRLDDRQLALFIAQGRVIVRVRVLDPGDAVRIDAPNTQVQLTRIGLYGVDVTPDRQATLVTVREGEAQVALANGAAQALPGQTVTVTGQDPVTADLRNGLGQDGFDAWSANRDRYYEQSVSAAYVSPQTVGYADLDPYGSWQQYPDYGAVWFPNSVAPDWAPYSDGYWADVGGWGYTWVDFAPWGYAPFHYGRWARIGGRWGWCPGSHVARPSWAPALVVWHGGPGWGLSTRRGSPVYGWLPLGWRDPYLPPWRHCSSRCWTRLNQPYGVNVRERPRLPPAHYANAAVPGAITAVTAAGLMGARPVAANRVPVPTQLAASAPVLDAPPARSPDLARLPAVKPVAGAPPPASTLYSSGRSPTGNAGARSGAATPRRSPAPIANAATDPGAAVPARAARRCARGDRRRRSRPRDALPGASAAGRDAGACRHAAGHSRQRTAGQSGCRHGAIGFRRRDVTPSARIRTAACKRGRPAHARKWRPHRRSAAGAGGSEARPAARDRGSRADDDGAPGGVRCRQWHRSSAGAIGAATACGKCRPGDAALAARTSATGGVDGAGTGSARQSASDPTRCAAAGCRAAVSSRASGERAGWPARCAARRCAGDTRSVLGSVRGSAEPVAGATGASRRALRPRRAGRGRPARYLVISASRLPSTIFTRSPSFTVGALPDDTVWNLPLSSLTVTS